MKGFGLIAALLLIPGTLALAEVRTDPDTETKYWENNIGPQEVAPRYQDGRSIKNELFEVKNLAFNRRHHTNGLGDYLTVTFDIFNVKNDPFEGYMFVVASMEKRYRRGPSYYVLVTNISPDPTNKNVSFNVSEGFFPIKQKEIASGDGGKEVLGQMTREELLNNQAKDPTKGIPINVKDRLQVDIKHFMRYSREQKFFDHVTILIYGKQKQKMVGYKITDDPKRQGKKQMVRFEEKKEGDKTVQNYIVEEKFPLLFSERIRLTNKLYNFR